jgi:phosphatidylinositol dimannoside acyltransferase
MSGWLQGASLRRAAIFGATRAPRWFVRAAPVFIGVVLSFCLGRERRRVLSNLRRIFGRRSWFQEWRDVRLTFVEFARSLTDGLSRDRFAAPRFEIRGREGILGILERPAGFLLGTVHVGPWDLIAQLAFRESQRRVLVVMAREGESEAASVHDQSRQASTDFLRLGSHPLDALPVLRHLEQGGIVATQLDRPAPLGETRALELFGTSDSFAVGPFRLAGLAGVPLVPVLSARLGEGYYRVEVLEPLYFSARPSAEEIERALARLAGPLERHLREFPTQWFDFRHESPAEPDLTRVEEGKSGWREPGSFGKRGSP